MNNNKRFRTSRVLGREGAILIIQFKGLGNSVEVSRYKKHQNTNRKYNMKKRIMQDEIRHAGLTPRLDSELY